MIMAGGVPQNVEEAEQWFRRAAAAGHAEAQQNLERLLASIEAAAEAVTPADDLQKGLAAYEAGDYETALAILTPLAWAGNADAQNTLGWMYDYGHGVEENDAEAVKWYRRAAEQGNAIAQNNLGKMYEHGIGVSQNDEEAIKWYRSAADLGHAEARQNLDGLLASTASAADGTASAANLQEGIAGLVEWGLPKDDSAEPADDNTAPVADDTASAVDEAALEAELRKGLDAYDANDYITAFTTWTPLAEAGYADAQFNLGWLYGFGRGVDEDDAEELKWYRRAIEGFRLRAEAGDAEAQNNLGRMYENGWGVEDDDAEAIKWYRLAAEQGNVTAQANLGDMYYYGQGGVSKDYGESLKWFASC